MSDPGKSPDPTKPMSSVQRAVSNIYDGMSKLEEEWVGSEAPSQPAFDRLVSTTNYQSQFIESGFASALRSAAISAELRGPSAAYTSFRSIWRGAPDPGTYPRAKVQLDQCVTLLSNAWPALERILYGPVDPTPPGVPPTGADLTWFQQLQELAKQLLAATKERSFGPQNTEAIQLASEIDVLIRTAPERLSSGGQQFLQFFPATWKTFQNMRNMKEYSMATRQIAPFLSQVSEAAERVRSAR